MSQSDTMESAGQESVWERLVLLWERLDEHFHLTCKLKKAKEYSYEHPIMTLFIMVVLGMCSVPILGFICFAVGTVVVTFLGFMFFEGSLLFIGTIVLGFILCFTGFFSIAFCMVLVTSWFLFSASYKWLIGARHKIEEYYHQRHESNGLKTNEYPDSTTKYE